MTGGQAICLSARFLWGTRAHVDDDHAQKVRSLLPAKALAIAAYGESVATYRYRTLSAKVTNPVVREEFLAMADEEQGHHAVMQELIEKHFPGDFVLTPEDKALIIVGQRMLDAPDDATLAAVLPLIVESERLTGRFYHALVESIPRPELRSFFRAMGDECFDHADRLLQLPITPYGS